jgi:hypothetical protein
MNTVRGREGGGDGSTAGCKPRKSAIEIKRLSSMESKRQTTWDHPPLTLHCLNMKIRLLSRDRKSSEQFTCFNHRDHEIKAELALSGIVPSMMSEANQEEAI